ncbi:MAG: amidohydrolase family protein [Chloroflexota bacterium]
MLKIMGMLDPHTHLRDLDWAHKATFTSETRAAIAGGYTAVFDMPNTPPNTTSKTNLQTKLDKLDAGALCDYGVYFGASQDDNTAEYAGLSGVCGLKIFCNDTTGNLLVESVEDQQKHIAAWQTGRVISVHAEGETVEQILKIVREQRKHVQFLHISTADEIKMLRAAKADGLPVSIGVCPHHLYLTQDDLPALGPLGLMKPELKTKADRDALWQALQAGVVDVIESDHAPHTLAEKHNDEGKPVYGVPGLETTLPLMLLAVEENRLQMQQIPDLLAANPRRIFGVAAHADTYTIVDPDAACTIENTNLHTQSGWSPFAGMRVYGAVREVWIRGTQVYDGENFIVEPGFGENLFV